MSAARKDDYVALGRRTGAILKEYGATRVVECWIDDEPDGDAKFHGEQARGDLDTRTDEMVTSFAQALRTSGDELVVFSFTEWPDKETRDKGLSAAMADPRMQVADQDPIFDGRRLISSGFTPIIEL